MRGVAHEVMLVAFVVIFAIAGVGYLVASHADSCPVTPHPVSSVVTPPNCTLAPAGVSCVIDGVPTNGTYKQIVKPTMIVGNASGKIVHKVHIDNYMVAYGSQGPRMLSRKLIIQGLSAGNLSFHPFKPYKVPYASSPVQFVVYEAAINQSPTFACSASMKLPAAPVVPASPIINP